MKDALHIDENTINYRGEILVAKDKEDLGIFKCNEGCYFCYINDDCINIKCTGVEREDCKDVIFVKKTKENV